MTSYIKNLLKQLPYYGKTTNQFTNPKLLSELPFFEKPKKAKIKQLTTKKLLQEQPFYKQSMKKLFYDDINISRNESVLRGYAEAYKAEIINNRNLSDSSSVSKKSIKDLFNKLLREKKGF